MYIASAVHACGVCALGELALVIAYDTLMHVLMSVPIPPAQGRVGIWRGLAIHSCQYPCTGAHLSSYYWGESKRAPHQWTQLKFFCLCIYMYVYMHIYLPYVIPNIPVFYFNDLRIWTVHAHVLCVMLHRDIRKGELWRHKNKEWQSYMYSNNVLCIVSLAYHLDPVM